MNRKLTYLVGLSLFYIALTFYQSAEGQSALPEEFFGGVWNAQGDSIALSTRSELWIYTDELQFVQQLDTRLPGASTDDIPDIYRIRWSPDGARLAAIVHFEGVAADVYGLFNYLILWDTTTWQRLATIRHVRASSSLAWNPDGTEFAVTAGTFGAELHVYNAQSGEFVRSIASTVTEAIRDFDWNPTNPNEMAITIGDGLELWNPLTSQPLTVLTTYDSDLPPYYNPQTAELAFVNGAFDVEIWNTQTQQLVRTIDAPNEVLLFGWVDDDLLTTELDGIQRRWDIQTGQSTIIPTENGYRSWRSDGASFLLFASDRLVLIETATGNIQAQLVLNATSQVSSFTALDGLTNEALPSLSPMATGSEISLSQVNPENLVLHANTDPNTVGSVVFDLDTTPDFQTDNTAPYDLTNWSPSPGAHVLTATPYSGADGTGTAGAPLTIGFTVVEAAACTATISAGNVPALINTIWKISWSPDGTQIAVGSPEGVRLYTSDFRESTLL